MNIKNFEKYVDSTIVMRGKDYYKNRSIISLDYDEGEWTAEVEGSEDYTVSVSVSESGDILETFCDCPYDWGTHCKHEAAVFFAIREDGTKILKEQKSKNKEKLEDILEKLDKQTLISIIKEYAKAYKPMKSEIEFRYSAKTDTTKSARDVIRSSINAVKRGGYVEYRDVNTATDGAGIVIQMIDDKIDTNEILLAVSLGVVVLEEMVDLIAYCDDSNGYVGGAIYGVLEKIDEAVLSMPINHKDSKKVFDAIMCHAHSSIYDGWTEWRMHLLSSLVPLCSINENRKQLEAYISESKSQSENEWMQNYELRQLKELQFKIISFHDGKAAIRKYIEQNLDNITFLKMAIKLEIENKEYEKALALCAKGEEENNHYAGIVKDLMMQRYEIYEITNQNEEQKALAFQLFMNGDFDYYLKYKALHSKREWEAAFQAVLERAEEVPAYGIYQKIIIHEKHKPRILAYCQKSLYAIVDYHTYLLPEYRKEVGQIFSDYMFQKIERIDGRSQYKEVCRLIKMCDKVCPGATDAVCEEIFLKYARRPAFMDEMRKIGKIVDKSK